MSFSERPFAQRFASMGDQAESVYEAVAPLGNTIRFGFRRPKGINFGSLPDTVKHMPDFLSNAYLVEVMGLGRDGILKSMKVSKYEALKIWNKHAQQWGLLGLVLFIWNSSKKQYIILAWKDIVDEVAYSKKKYGVQRFEVDGNEYYRLDWPRLIDKATFVGSFEDAN